MASAPLDDETPLMHHRGAPGASRHPDRLIAGLAADQHGVVDRQQLSGLGLSDRQIGRRVESGRLHRLHPAVYAVGHPVTTTSGRYLAAVLAVGPGGILRRRSAADLLAMRPTSSATVEVLTPRRCRSRPGLDVGARGDLDPHDVTEVDGIPVTAPMRTLVDLAGVVDAQGLARALRRADDAEQLDMTPLNRLLASRPRGAATLRALLRDYAEGPRQRSELERMLLGICRVHHLPRPQCNVLLDGHELDFLWPDHKLIAEVDSWLYHRSRHAFGRDRRRDVDLLAGDGYRTARFTDLQLLHESQWVARSLAKLLAVR